MDPKATIYTVWTVYPIHSKTGANHQERHLYTINNQISNMTAKCKPGFLSHNRSLIIGSYVYILSSCTVIGVVPFVVILTFQIKCTMSPVITTEISVFRIAQFTFKPGKMRDLNTCSWTNQRFPYSKIKLPISSIQSVHDQPTLQKLIQRHTMPCIPIHSIIDRFVKRRGSENNRNLRKYMILDT